MLYRKNLPVWERIVRICAGLATLSCAIHFWGTPLSYIWGAGALFLAGTSIFGFCPTCAVVGRRNIDSTPRTKEPEKARV